MIIIMQFPVGPLGFKFDSDSDWSRDSIQIEISRSFSGFILFICIPFGSSETREEAKQQRERERERKQHSTGQMNAPYQLRRIEHSESQCEIEFCVVYEWMSVDTRRDAIIIIIIIMNININK